MTASLLEKSKFDEFSAFVEKLQNMIPFSAFAPVNEEEVLRSKFMPKKSKIVSGKVIAAVERSKNSNGALNTASPSNVSPPEPTSQLEPSSVESGDFNSRFKQRKGELEVQRHANDPKKLNRLEKRRAEETKSKQKDRKQKRQIDSNEETPKPSDDKKTRLSEDASSKTAEEGSFVFSRTESDLKKKKQHKAASNPKVALKQLEAERETIQKLRETDVEKARAFEEKLQIKKAILKVKGASVKDNVVLLKKSIQRQEKQKEKSRLFWDEKKTELDETQKKRQDKRQANVQSRIDAKKAKKMGGGKGGKKFKKPSSKSSSSKSFKSSSSSKFAKKPRKH